MRVDADEDELIKVLTLRSLVRPRKGGSAATAISIWSLVEDFAYSLTRGFFGSFEFCF